jgi:hypothetical protein
LSGSRSDGAPTPKRECHHPRRPEDDGEYDRVSPAFRHPEVRGHCSKCQADGEQQRKVREVLTRPAHERHPIRIRPVMPLTRLLSPGFDVPTCGSALTTVVAQCERETAPTPGRRPSSESAVDAGEPAHAARWRLALLRQARTERPSGPHDRVAGPRARVRPSTVRPRGSLTAGGSTLLPEHPQLPRAASAMGSSF